MELFPSWETLPHERLSPRADTVGQRLEVLRRLAHPEEHPAGRVKVIVATDPQPDPADGAAAWASWPRCTWRSARSTTSTSCVDRLVELAYARVDMVEKRGEFAVRGGILDIFPPTAQHPVRVEFWGDEVTEIRRVRGRRPALAAAARSPAFTAPPCRELLLTEPVKARAAALAAEHQADAQLAEMLDKLADGIAVEGMEALIPALCRGRAAAAHGASCPRARIVLVADPEKIRTRAQDLVRTGQEFLEASWMAAASGGKAPIDLGASAYRDARRRSRRTHADSGRAVVDADAS